MKGSFLFKAVMLLLVFTPVLRGMPAANRYCDELVVALATQHSLLGKVSQLGSGPALGVLRSAQWRDYLAATQGRGATWRDMLGYFFMENEIASFSDRCYVLPQAELPFLYATASEYAQKLGIAVPVLLLVDDRKLVEATAACWSRDAGFIVLGRGLFEGLSESEFCGVLAYYMGAVAERYQAKMAKRFIPVFLVGLAAMLYSVSKISGGKETVSLRRGLACIGILGAYGAALATYWSILARHFEYKADLSAGMINPANGLAMINAYDRFHKENTGGDLLVAQDIVSHHLPHLSSKDAHKSEEFIKTMGALYALIRKENELVGSSIFATHRSLNARRVFFSSLIGQQELQSTPVP